MFLATKTKQLAYSSNEVGALVYTHGILTTISRLVDDKIETVFETSLEGFLVGVE